MKRSSTKAEQDAFYSEFCARLIEAREIRGMSAAKLARLLNISPSTMSKYESGLHVPDSIMIIKMADALNVSADYLLGR